MKSVASSGWESGERPGGAWVLGIDVGGTGSRAALEPVGATVRRAGPALRADSTAGASAWARRGSSVAATVAP